MKLVKICVYGFSILGFALHSVPSLASVKTAASDAMIQKQILKLVNQYRVQHRLSVLEMNPIINAEATKHSQDMARHKIPFGHQYFPQRVKTLYQHIKQANGAAENVAYNYRDIQDLVNRWVKSSGHRKNIVGSYKLTGIGVARDTEGRPYYTQIFVNTRG